MASPKNQLNIDYRGKLTIREMSDEFPVKSHLSDLDNIAIQWHWHDSFEACIVHKGKMELNVEFKKYIVDEGDAFILKPGILHSVTPIGKETHELIVIQFFPRLVGGDLPSIFWKKYLFPLINNQDLKSFVLTENYPWQEEARSLLKKTAEAIESPFEGYEFDVRSDLSRVLFLCLNNTNKPLSADTDRDRRDAERLMKMLNYIGYHYSEDITTEMIAQSAMISESECQRCFKRVTKSTPIKYLRKLRLQRSMDLLADKSLKISDIALQCGFKEISYYSSMFKKVYGMTPGEYRNSL